MYIDTSIFKAYDIRGIYPDNLNEDLAEKVGRAYSHLLRKEIKDKDINIVVGNDMRLSSPSLKERLILGLTASGINVVDVGLVTTPTFYFSVGYYGYDGGIQVSASHNPKEYNGFKLVRKNAYPVGGDTGLYEMRDMIIKNDFKDNEHEGKIEKKGGVVEEEVRVQSKGIDISKIKQFKIVADSGNGMGALDLNAVFGTLHCDLQRQYFELDGTFPNHVPDPLKEENLEWLKNAVIEKKADLGIATDGDGDRWFFVDEKGETVPQPILRGLMAQIELKDNPGATVCYDIRPGKITKEMIEEVGGKASVTKVGHSLIKKQMLEEGAIFGGESSGHYFYKLPYGTFEAPIILLLKFLKHISEQGKPVSEIIFPYKKYFHSGEINSEVADKDAKMKLIEEIHSDGTISKLDGISIEFEDYWFNVRSSNTESLLRFQVEAKTEKLMKEKRDEILKLIRSN